MAGLLSGLFGSDKPKRRKDLKKPKANATIKQMEKYVEKKSKKVADAVKKEQLRNAVDTLSKVNVTELAKKRR